MKTKNTIFAIPAAAPAIPPKPSAAAISAMMSSDMTKPSMMPFSVVSQASTRGERASSCPGERGFLPALPTAALRMTRSNLVGIVFRWESEESGRHDEGQHRIKLRLRPLNRSCQLVAEAIELGEKGSRLAHRGAACWERSAATWSSNVAKLWRCNMTLRPGDSALRPTAGAARRSALVARLNKVPLLRRLPARLLTVGFRPEHVRSPDVFTPTPQDRSRRQAA